MAAAGPSTSKDLVDLYGDLSQNDDWTSDKDITCMAQTLGVRDITEIKFAENKVNGQSRGFAEVVVTSEESLKLMLEKIPQCQLNGERIDCRFATRQNLSVFEDLANKRKSTTTLHYIAFQNVRYYCHIPIQPPPSLHVNPAFFTPAQDGHSSKAYSQQKHTPQSTDRDFEELMNRNKAVASSAISKAVSGATAGVAVVLGTKKDAGTGVVTESESGTGNVKEKTILVGKVRECLEDKENIPGVGRGTKNAHGNGKGTEISEITETDTANLTHGVLKCEDGQRLCFCTKLYMNLVESKVRLKLYLQKSKVYFFLFFTSCL
ncbi:hypothetical protein FQN60_010994 [Etheostoma spectabile]|uniref:CPSF6/7 RSLD domain-containing protein n=1 Tax=Etheostoma spectabile TaxID=54343 RepID=A0A5J5DR69_9PERO|nr:hypothetical protein FQN60_010994 [Etheostoma spectabile]